MSNVFGPEPSRSSGRKLWRDKKISSSSKSPAVSATPTTQAVDQRRPNGLPDVKINALHQSASDVNLPATAHAVVAADPVEKGGLKRVMSDTSLPIIEIGTRQDALVQEKEAKQSSTRRRMSRLSKLPPKVSVAKYAITESPTETKITELPKAHLYDGKSGNSLKSKSSTSLSSLAKRSSWIIGSSRSPSPSNRKASQQREAKPEEAPGPTLKRGPPPPIQLPEPLDKAVIANGPLSPVKRRGTFGSTRVRRPLSEILTGSSDHSIPSFPKSYSTDRLPTTQLKQEMLPALPTPVARERLQASFPEAPRKKDELWSVFRTLDGEFTKFNTKPGTLKANIIRTSLLTFLKTYFDHPSNKSLRAEDLDRRVNILNKWWTGLLEMLNGRNGQSVSPNDRPAVLDGLSGIMVRPEWRLSMATISSRPERHRPNAQSRSTTSLASTASDFLAESVLHNVRSLFVQNLLSQMAFVVERMSLRTVPASVVAFCGKAAAYAFFFCPGVADILIRLWALPQATLRRILDDENVPRNTNLKATAETTAKHFPAHLRHLVLTSLPALIRNLRGRSAQSLTLDYIPWYGPWVGRWTGRDSDLFFGFAKQYYTLLSEMLPEDANHEERICAPCAILVEGQLLAVLDATIHRGSAMAQAEAPQNVTFDEILGADASAAPLPVHAPNTARLMAENRLIMLCREFLHNSPTITETARSAFADMFGVLLKAATKRTSLHDHEACFILCDFLEESMFILARYHRGAEDPVAFLDWNFWFDVLKRLGNSNNTMTEVRLYSFVYSLWGFIARSQDKKHDICMKWLLEEDFAYRQFNHWCPMVRAYYQRLLVWRVGRCDSEPTDIDMEIYETLLQRLTTYWEHYLFRLVDSHQKGERPPSTAPATPAPSRRLLIVRDDSVPTPGAVFSALLASEPTPNQYEKYTSLETLNQVSTLTVSSPSKSPNQSKKRWTFLRSINPFSSSSSASSSSTTSTSEATSAPPKPPATNTITHTPTASTSSSTSSASTSSNRTSLFPPSTPSTTPPSSAQPSPPLGPVDRTHRSFKFTLEWTDRSLTLANRKLFPPQLPHTSRAILQRDAEETSAHGVRPEEKWKCASRYVGVALAEWGLLVGEMQGFYERRRVEGVRTPREVETPRLGVESFRRPIG